MKSTHSPTRLSLIILLACLWSGCFGEAPGNDVQDPEAWGVRQVPTVLSQPIRFQGAGPDGNVYLNKSMQEECRWAPRPITSYRLFDRNGLVADEVLEIDLAESREVFPIAVSGESPWVLVGDINPCMTVRSTLDGARGAELLRREMGFDLNDALRWENLTVTLEDGQTMVTAAYVPNSTVARVQAAWFDFVAGRALFSGRILIDYADGEPWATHNFAVNGAHTADFQPIQFHPDGYVIRIEPNLPAVSDVVIRFTFQTIDLHGLLCDHGFEWQECGAQDSP